MKDTSAVERKKVIMNHTIRIDDIKDVKVGDTAYFKGDPVGYKVLKISVGPPDGMLLAISLDVDELAPVIKYVLEDVLIKLTAWVRDSLFDHAERTFEWPQPSDFELHVYLGADGKKYLYLPTYEYDVTPWHQLPYWGSKGWHDAEDIAMCYPTALPLKELKFVQEEEES
mgnify:CR=1 FL=1